MQLTDEEQAWARGESGPAMAMATRILAEMGRILGADRLIPVTSAHIDGCLYHGDSGVHFAERLVAGGGQVRVPTTLNVGALNLLKPEAGLMPPAQREMARRLMVAYIAMGCRQTWTCAPYQVGHRPAQGEDIAWGGEQCGRLCQLGSGGAHQPLWRFSGHLRRPHRARTSLRTAPAGESTRHRFWCAQARFRRV